MMALGRDRLDIGQAGDVHRVIGGEAPDLVINAAAYTAVDRAEAEPELAMRLNGAAPGWLATAARAVGARFVHVSSDFVFDGTRASPYPPDAPPNPLSVYGRSKLEGERAVLAAHPDALVVRTAWVHDGQGRNFVRTMLGLMQTREEVRVVCDQLGTPTHAPSLARAIWGLVAAEAKGVFHWTDAGVASWYDFAVAIQEEGLALGLLDRAVPVRPIRTADYPTPARRPACAILDKEASWRLLGPARHWRVELRSALAALAAARAPA